MNLYIVEGKINPFIENDVMGEYGSGYFILKWMDFKTIISNFAGRRDCNTINRVKRSAVLWFRVVHDFTYKFNPIP